MKSSPMSASAEIPIIVYVAIADENTLATFEAALRNSLDNVDIVKFKDGQSLISELQSRAKRPDMIFFKHPLAQGV